MQRTWLGAGGMDSVSCMINVEDPQEAAFASLCQLGVHVYACNTFWVQFFKAVCPRQACLQIHYLCFGQHGEVLGSRLCCNGSRRTP